jgi:hypothetical protein
VADGAARIGARTSGTLPADSVRTQLDALNASAVRTNAANVFSATQTINGTADENAAALVTATSPLQRKLLWEISGGADAYKYRVYAGHFTFEITVNARWDGTQWVRDAAAFGSSKLELNGSNFRLNSTDANNAPIGDNWPNRFDIELVGHGRQSIDVGGNLTSSGATETYVGWQGSSPPLAIRVGAGASFRKQFPAVPSSITFAVLSSQNVATGPTVVSPTGAGTGAFIETTNVNTITNFYARVFAS